MLKFSEYNKLFEQTTTAAPPKAAQPVAPAPPKPAQPAAPAPKPVKELNALSVIIQKIDKIKNKVAEKKTAKPGEPEKASVKQGEPILLKVGVNFRVESKKGYEFDFYFVKENENDYPLYSVNTTYEKIKSQNKYVIPLKDDVYDKFMDICGTLKTAIQQKQQPTSPIPGKNKPVLASYTFDDEYLRLFEIAGQENLLSALVGSFGQSKLSDGTTTVLMAYGQIKDSIGELKNKNLNDLDSMVSQKNIVKDSEKDQYMTLWYLEKEIKMEDGDLEFRPLSLGKDLKTGNKIKICRDDQNKSVPIEIEKIDAIK